MSFDRPRSADTQEESDLRRARLFATRQALGAHGIVAEVAESEPLLCVAGRWVLSIGCDRRASDNGSLWLFENKRTEPIAPADAAHIHEVITWVKGRLAAQAAT